jgi:hypothetical protein
MDTMYCNATVHRKLAEQGVTQLLIDWKSGSKDALDLLTPLVYNELRRLADHYLRETNAPRRLLQPTALVHEAYLRLVAQSLPDWESRSHFFGVAAHRMRQVLVDHARRRRSAERGRGAERFPSKRCALAFLGLFEIERSRVHAVTKMRGRGAIFEYMAQVRIAFSA